MIILSKLRCTVLFFTSIFSFSIQAANAPVIADTYINSLNTGKNVKPFGNAITLNVSDQEKALLNFNLTALPFDIIASDITKATLFLYVKYASAVGKLQVKEISSSWIENSVTFNNAPISLNLPSIISPNIMQKETYLAVDITDIVKDWVTNPNNNYGLSLEPNTSGLKFTFDSKEATTTSHPAYVDIVFNHAVNGIKGDKGDQGEKGDVGPKGDTGSQGIQGLTGPKGDKGDQGVKGDIGATGQNDTYGHKIISNTGGAVSTVMCDSDEVILGGGGTCSNIKAGGESIISWSRPYPDNNPNGWIIFCGNTQYNPTSTVFAICVKK